MNGHVALERPRPLPVDVVERGWLESAQDPEMACASTWSDVCCAWWSHPSDDRLRRRTFDALCVDDAELRAWQARRLDAAVLVRVHSHVIAARAELERDLWRRRLVTGALRTTDAFIDRRDGGRFLFVDASEIHPAVERLAATLNKLPQHPFVRAAWIVQAVGAIHPFVDGNGGTSRFLASLELSRASLPPLVLSLVQRNTTYNKAVAEGAMDLRPLQRVVYDTVQSEIAASLLDGTGGFPDLSDSSRARFVRWTAITDRCWRAAASMPVTIDEYADGSLARFARRGFKSSRGARCVRWATRAPLPVQLELAVSPLRGGDEPWLVAALVATIADGTLGLLSHPEYIPSYFAAPSSEDDQTADARFERWVMRRLSQTVRGLASWM